MEYKIGIIVPYFGKLPKFFKYWYESASLNSEVDFHIITDQNVNLNSCSNIFYHKMDFSIFREMVNALLGVKFLRHPYKMCDYKPTYGHLFHNILFDYDFWGYADIDLVFGDLRILFDIPGVFKEYDKILDLGHLSFYRNISAVNRLFCKRDKGCDFWSYVRDSNIIWVYDENYLDRISGINGKIISNKLKLFSDRTLFSDVDPGRNGFFDTNNGPSDNCFFWTSFGKLRRTSLVEGKIFETEIIYAHFQKREVCVVDCSNDVRLFLPNHWPSCSNYEEAINLLFKFKNEDMVKNISYSKWKTRRKINKIFNLFKEVIFVRGALKCIIKAYF